MWQPVLPFDDDGDAADHAGAETDARAAHFWDTGTALGLAFAAPLGATDPPDEFWSSSVKAPVAWDVVLLYERGARWTDAGLPLPGFWMFPGPDPERGLPAFDASILRTRVAAALGHAAAVPRPVPPPTPAGGPAPSSVLPSAAPVPPAGG
ncbi:MAG TPA: hypothetical protein VG389_10165 [Myxococcota bacterium]|nr:hypothetical protein [Myxococcota bacterium]